MKVNINMEIDMEKENNMIMVNYNMKVNIIMEKEQDMEKNIILMVN